MKKWAFQSRKKQISYIVLLVLIVFLIIYKREYIYITNESNNVVVYELINNNEEFSILSEHSVSHSQITEYYNVQNAKINNYKTMFTDEGGAGFPSSSDITQFKINKNGNFILNHNNNGYNNINVIIDNNMVITFDKFNVRLKPNIDVMFCQVKVVDHNIFNWLLINIRKRSYDIQVDYL